MKNVNNITFSQDGQEVFEKIIAIWPRIIRDRKKGKILFILSLLKVLKFNKTKQYRLLPGLYL